MGKVHKAGHRYELKHLDGRNTTMLQFVQRLPHHEPKEGVTCQEVLGVLIDRVKFLNKELPWHGNEDILHHLRCAFAGFESRAIYRKALKDELYPEEIAIGIDGHFELKVKLTNG